MQFISDVHGAFDAMDALPVDEPLFILGDLLNLMDYRTGEGITADVLGLDFARAVAEARAAGDYARMRSLWTEHVDDPEDFRRRFSEGAERQYREAAEVLGRRERVWVTFGNVDRPDMLRSHLPPSATFVDGDVVDFEGVRFGFVGGGLATPLGALGEVSDDEMEAKLEAMGEVDVLCSHLPPAVEPLFRDVVTGRLERGSRPILEYLHRTAPRFHLFGDVHQPQASQWRIGATTCRNVGYFRATGRPVRFDPATMTLSA